MAPRYYLTLSQVCSQVWCNKYSIVLVLLAVKVYTFLLVLRLTLDHLVDLVDTINVSLDHLASTATTIPTQLTQLTNKLVAEQLQQLKSNLKLSLLLLVSVIRALIGFYMEIFLGTFTCLLDAAAQSSVDFALDSAQATLKGLNTTIVAVTSEVESGLEALSSFIESSINTVLSLFSSNDKPSVTSINLSLGKLRNLQIPGSVTDELDSFRLNFDEFDHLKNSTINLITAPLTHFDRTVSGLDLFGPMNSSKMAVANYNSSAAKNVTFDLTEVKNSIGDFKDDAAKLALIMMIVLVSLSVMTMIALVLMEKRNFVKRDNFVISVREKSLPLAIGNALETYQNRTIHYMAKLKLNPRYYWICNYLTSKYAMVGLGIGLVGVLSFILQYCLLLSVENKLQNLIGTVSSPEQTKQLQASLSQYTAQTNNYIKDQSKTLNENVLGWYMKASTNVNDTLTEILNQINLTIHTVTGNTPLSKPFEVVVYCVIGRKLIAVTEGITWLNEHLVIDLPQLPVDLFKDVTETVPLRYGKQLESQMVKATNLLEQMLFIELYVALGFVGIWVIFIVMGIIMMVTPRKRTIGSPKLLTATEKEEYIFPLSSFNTSLSVYSTLNGRPTS